MTPTKVSQVNPAKVTQIKTLKESRTWSLRALGLVRGLVLALILLSIGTLILDIARFPSYGARNLATVIPNDRWSPQTTLLAINQLGWSPEALSWLYAILGWLTAAAYCAVGLIVFARRPESWFGLYVAAMFGVLGTSGGLAGNVPAETGTFLAAWEALVSLLGWQFLLVFFYLFPDGRFVPAWTRWLAVGWVVVNLLWILAPGLEEGLTPFIFALALSTMGSQIYRYFRHSDVIQRQQTKWIVFMVAVLILLLTLLLFSFYAVGPSSADLGRGFLIATSIQFLSNVWLLFFPIVVAIAILRYRLWDIDIIIRRTLVYVPLTAILAGVFSATIKVTQTFLAPQDGQQSDAATVLTTLIVVAAFDPVKGWLQRRVDALFKEAGDPRSRWAAYAVEVQTFLDRIDPSASARRLLAEAMAAFEATDGAVYLQQAGKMHLLHSQGDVNAASAISVPLEHDGRALGRLELGQRRAGRVYDHHDLEALTRTASVVARAIAITSTLATMS